MQIDSFFGNDENEHRGLQYHPPYSLFRFEATLKKTASKMTMTKQQDPLSLLVPSAQIYAIGNDNNSRRATSIILKLIAMVPVMTEPSLQSYRNIECDYRMTYDPCTIVPDVPARVCRVRYSYRTIKALQ